MRNASIRFIAVFASALALAISPPALALSTDQAESDITKFVEWAFGFKLDAAAVQSIRDGTAIDMSSDPSGAQATVNDMDNVMAWAAKHSASDNAILRSLVEPQIIAAFQADTGASAATERTLVAAWRKHNKIIAEGTPPLRQSVVDAFIAMYEFTAKQAGKPVPAAIADHAGFARRIAGQYPGAPAEAQMKFNQFVPWWLSLQSLWAQATPAEQHALRAAFRGKPVAAQPPPTPAPQSGLSGNISTAQLIKKIEMQHWTSSQAQHMMEGWSSVFGHF
ncbi:MAG TPA: hypothetical protein VN934_09405 [Candidatus Tumulicola sp.]|nr:hypothetical protein [Candidatus Tumulicola sp.]